MILPPNTPVLIGVGQAVDHWDGSDPAAAPSPQSLMQHASEAALADTGVADAVRSAIDVIAVVRHFADSAPGMVPEGTGGCDKPPLGLAARLGITPARAIYSIVGGQSPQALVNEFAAEIHAGKARCVLLSGSEAIATAKTAARKGVTLDWNETIAGDMEDRGLGPMLLDRHELRNGVGAPILTYPLFEHALRARLGRTRTEHVAEMSALWADFSEVAAANPYAQFPKAMSADYLATPSDSNYPVADPYLKWHVAQDAVNQGAALILTSAGQAEAMGVPRSHWLFLHGSGEAMDKNVSLRPDLSRSRAIEVALKGALASAGKTPSQIAHYDIYSCFPVAVLLAAEALGIDERTTALTLTGGLPFAGGAGNNYSMHAIAAMTQTLRADPGSYGLILANGGFLSKEAVGIYSTTAPEAWTPVDHAPMQAEIDAEAAPARLEEHATGTIESYTVGYAKGRPARAVVIARTATGRVIARPADGDKDAAIAALLDPAKDPIGRTVHITHTDGVNSFTVAE
ncbi:acetyl-CoA acetyltransferase [Blastomonas aquatica]|uniref:Acetyl-CoA acetyltransferase n=1 Tax=Blastomonas aquatica TaxID=1510276 RepID=A0ABQ1JM60_9SPHN|nr:acetyl-CoA acetyltransferase [Blastomonas aquatica]GGB72491.1 acetyl-CoA acetyltransferase [Blastomonas aquatica]